MATTLLTSTSNTLGGRPGRTSLLEIRDHARLIDHHAAHISSTRNSTSASTYSSSSAPRAPAAGIWTSPPPSHSVPGGEVSSDWTNPDELEKSKTIAIKNGSNWPEQRGTPAYRPIDTHLDHSRRPWANTVPETLFTITMIGLGVQAIGLANTLFRRTVGKIESVDRLFRYQAPHEL
ncbi:uncharacterized protein UMAG_03406 [Mycosarcoma maydis]|uniref:Uncharacterized protein n=1 Tax=Mycosarcoma maydis TaxID=5270 RepID=A0A0D1C3J9_MYCMD|nr:uncharacterized protein UMAG_03406 [Ustilago maydis 521]KIS68307.1 hypothetical protein UMAG_03406 [Ustilago maydis 521]|eukprot:XP_011389879.1 hypothetical protein UMAG_03406 [Ustilago maydis 521]